jgi:hypothetical protein
VNLGKLCAWLSWSQWLNGLRRVCGRSLAGIAGLNPAGGTDGCPLWVLSGRRLCDGLITHPEESYRLWCVLVCDLGTSRVRQLKLVKDCKCWIEEGWWWWWCAWLSTTCRCTRGKMPTEITKVSYQIQICDLEKEDTSWRLRTNSPLIFYWAFKIYLNKYCGASLV